MENTEQWNLNGDCKLCRRNKYCFKPCTRRKRRTQIAIESFVASKMDEVTGGAYSEIMSRSSLPRRGY